MTPIEQTARVNKLSISDEHNAVTIEKIVPTADLLQEMGIGVSVCDMQGNLLFMNKASLDFFGLDSVMEHQHRLNNFQNYYQAFTLQGTALENHERPIYKVIHGEKVTNLEILTIIPDKSITFIGSYSGAIITNENGEPAAALMMVRDITESKRIESALLESERSLRELADAMPQIIWTARPDGYLDYYNRRWFEFTGASEESTYSIQGWAPFLHPEDVDYCVNRWSHAYTSGEPYEIEYRFRRGSDGVYRWHLGRALPVKDEKGEIIKWVGTCTDIDDQKRAEEALEKRQAAIEELNERLQSSMQETHHRVKNNLQIIASMVDLQVMTGESSLPMDEFQRVSKHIRALALVHDLLTKEAKESSRAEFVSSKAVLTKVVEFWKQTSSQNVEAAILDDVRLSGKQGSSLAIIVNELISNSLKYGSTNTSINFKVNFSSMNADETSDIPPGVAIFDIVDDGTGFPSDFEFPRDAHTGLEIVDQLVRWDLRGAVTMENCTSGGASVTLSFPVFV